MRTATRPARPGAWESPGGSKRSRALLVAGAVVAAGALVATAGTAVLPPPAAPPGPSPAPLTVEQDTVEPARVAQPLRAVPSAPLTPRAHPHAVWTGEELLVWSGTLAVGPDGEPAVDANRRFAVAEDGAAYEPRTRRWRRLPPAPIAGRVGAAAVWAGDRLVVWGGFAGPDEPLADGAVYRPAENTWERLPRAPITGRGQAVAAWTGSEVLVVGGTRVAGRAAPARAATMRDGAAFDPDHGRWAALPLLPASVWPLAGRFAGAWTGEALVVWGRDLALYRPQANDWEQIRPPPTGLWSGVPVQAAPVGGGVVAFGLVVRRSPSVYGLAYDLDGDTFEPLPPLERTSMTSQQRGLAAADDRVVLLLGPPANAALAWEPGAPGWTALPDGLAGRDGAAVVWTGGSLLVWGGADGRTLRADGLAWTP